MGKILFNDFANWFCETESRDEQSKMFRAEMLNENDEYVTNEELNRYLFGSIVDIYEDKDDCDLVIIRILSEGKWFMVQSCVEIPKGYMI